MLQILYVPRKKEKNILLPSIPAYKKEFVAEVCKYFERWTKGFERKGLLELSPEETISLLKKRRLSSAGVEIFGYASRFLATEVDYRALEKAENILAKGIKELEAYEVRAEELGARHELEGYVRLPPFSGIVGGRAPIEGEMIETKPSAYSSLELSRKDTEEYLFRLKGLLFSSYPWLVKGFKTRKEDKKFGIFLENLFSKGVSLYLRS